MKKLLLFLVVELLPLIAYSQTYEPLQQTFSIDTGNGAQIMYISADLPYFQQNPLLGWTWTCGWKMTRALRMNSGHTDDIEIPSAIDSNVKCIIMPDPVWSNAQSVTVMQSSAIQYEPTLKLNDTMPWEFRTNLNDSTNPVFGFRYYNFLTFESVVISNRVTLNSGIRNIVDKIFNEKAKTGC